MTEKFGSSWKRWDLHVHTPCSVHENYGGNTSEAWERFILDLEALPPEFKVIGVNDYFFLDGYRKVLEYRKAGRLSKLELILPVIELRLDLFANLNPDDTWKKINLHIIFSNDVDADTIDRQFLNAIQHATELQPDHQAFFDGSISTLEDLINFGQAIKDSTTVEISESARIVGFNNLVFNKKEVFEKLRGAETHFGGKHLIAIGKAEWETLRWSGSISTKKDIINKSDLVFTASESPEAFQSGSVKLVDQGVNSLLVDCSDAHSFSDSSDKDRIGNCFSWIKADATFEGLKQITHERSRLWISLDIPLPPAKAIQTVRLSFPDDSMICRKENKSDTSKHTQFCLGGAQEINFSPYFTCLIGGRGTGKSTVLNLIAEKAGIPTSFFEQNIVLEPGRTLNTNEYVEINGSSDIEFISQNEVEKFADSGELTHAIYERLKYFTDFDGFTELERGLETESAAIDAQISNLLSRSQTEKLLGQDEVALKESETVVSSYSSPRYIEITEKLELFGTSIARTENAKAKFEALRSGIVILIQANPIETEPQNDYETALNTIITELSTILGRGFDFTAATKKYETEGIEHADLRKQLQDYLEKRGASPENTGEYDRASGLIPRLKTSIEEKKNIIRTLTVNINAYRARAKIIEELRGKFETKINENLTPLNEKLLKSNTDETVEDISFAYEFNSDEAKKALFELFVEQFSHITLKEYSTRIDYAADNLFCIEPDQVGDQDDFLTKLDDGTNTNAKNYLKAILEDPASFEIYKLLIKKCFNDVALFKSINGFYGPKELKACSFGQRCTAVIVALLMFGNKPLIIDEPEAHLDSKLIAEYLVDLIKKRKVERQFIFATHNANLVVNGDAELVNILEVGDDNLTTVTPTTIENLFHRSKLLNLEGGKDAFEKRDKRLIRT